MALRGLPMGGALKPSPLDATRPGEPLAYSCVGRKLAMTDIMPTSLMLAATLAIWAGIAWLLVERIRLTRRLVPGGDEQWTKMSRG
jgi:hypothetical protein